MGFCRRCGDITTGDRCKCGGTSKAASAHSLFQANRTDSWSRNYLSKSTSKPVPPPTNTFNAACAPSPNHRSASPTRPGYNRAPSSLKPSHTGGRKQQSEDETLRAFGCVIGPTQWCCVACQTKFVQEETIYPHPDAKTDPTLAELYFCRDCFAERFSKGACATCKFAVLSDAPFVKHDKRVWHDVCFSCSYCEDPQTDAILDFAGQPSCEDCFDAQAYKTRGVPASPHLAQSPFAKTAPRPAPTRWGRGSISTPPKSIAKASSSSPKTTITEETPVKGGAWRVRAEREKSPMVKSLDELGEKMRAVGLEKREPLQITQPRTESDTSPWAAKTTVALSIGRTAHTRTTVPPPTSSPFSNPIDAHSASAAASPSKSPFGRPLGSQVNSLPANSPGLPRMPASRGLSSASFSAPTPVKPTTSTPAPAPAQGVVDDEHCAVCQLELGYGELIQLPKTKQLMHRACFVCPGCTQQLSGGTHVVVDGATWHHGCAPSPKRYRSIVTSIKEDVPEEQAQTLFEEDGESACAGCSRLIGSAAAVTIPTNGKTFHQSCFTCAGCKEAFGSQGSQRSFVEVRGQPYHSTCAPKVATFPASAADPNPLRASSSRTVVSPALPASSSIPKFYYAPTSPTSIRPANSSSPSALFATRARPTPKLGGLIVCAGCSVRATEKETVQGPMGRRWHSKCLKCIDCARGLDSEARVGEDHKVRCESCRRGFHRRSAALGKPQPRMGAVA